MIALTRAPLLRRIIKMMKVSNQSCSTIVKHVLRRFHHFLPLPSVMSTVRHGQFFTHSEERQTVYNYFITYNSKESTLKYKKSLYNWSDLLA